MNDSYSEYYADKLEQGVEFQDFVIDLLLKEIGLSISLYGSRKYQNWKGESRQGIEIKFDDRYKSTGNIYIETHEKANPSRPNFTESGILRNDNTWLYVIGDYSNVFIFAKNFLINLYNTKRDDIIRSVEIPTSKGFLLTHRVAMHYCIKHIFVNEDQFRLFTTE